MHDFVSGNCVPDVLAGFLIRKLRRVTANDEKSFTRSELLFETMQLRQNMQAVDAAISEEVDKNQMTGELFLPLQRL